MALDVAAVALFVGIGRSSHHHAETLGGFFSTAWPFAVGLVAGWLLVRSRKVSLTTGAVVAATTVAIGMVLRVLAGQGTAAPFIVVALCFLGGVMIAGRWLLQIGTRRLGRSAPLEP